MIRSIAQLLVAATLFSVSIVAFGAGAPRDVQAELTDGKVVVRWTSPADQGGIAAFHVYYAARSILNNDGEYDDYERVGGRQVEATLTEFPRGTGELYIAVLPVDRDGKNLIGFDEEIRVGLESPAPQQQQPERQEDEVFALTEAKATSLTSILLSFTHAVTLSQSDAPKAFSIQDDRGAPLALTRLTIQGAEVKIDTAAQRPNASYTVRVAPVVFGNADGGAKLPLDAGRSAVTFASFSTGTQAPVAQVQPQPQQQQQPAQDPQPFGDVRNLDMRAERQADGRYLVVAVWDPVNGAESLQVRQTRDGSVYGDPQRIPGNAASVRFRDVTPGRFGIRVQAVSPSGETTAGAVASLTLAGTPTRSDDLSTTGAGAVGVLLLSGTAAGWIWSRKTRARAA